MPLTFPNIVKVLGEHLLRCGGGSSSSSKGHMNNGQDLTTNNSMVAVSQVIGSIAGRGQSVSDGNGCSTTCRGVLAFYFVEPLDGGVGGVSGGKSEFTSRLVTFYEKAAERGGCGLEVVLVVSADSEQTDFEEHVAVMPWLAVPYQRTETAKRLSRLLRVSSLPALVLVDAESGRVIDRNGLTRVTEDPLAERFPWSSRHLDGLLRSGPFLDAAGSSRAIGELDGSIRALYFSAHWCPPCKAFTPQLVHTYNRIRTQGNKLEVIFVSSDRSRESFDQYFGTMPWWAVPYEDEKLRKEFADLLGVQGIPTLVILDSNNKIITPTGRYDVIEDPEGIKFPWKPRLVEEVAEKFSYSLKNDPFIVLFTDGNEKEMDHARALLEPIAQELVQRNSEEQLWCFVGGETEICDSLRETAQLEDEVPLAVIIDLANREKHVLEDDVELTTDIIRNFVQDYINGELKGQYF